MNYLIIALMFLSFCSLGFAQVNDTNLTVPPPPTITNITLPNNTVTINGSLINLTLTWNPNQTVELARELNVSAMFFNNVTDNVTITPSSSPQWIRLLNGNENPFVLNRNESKNLTLSILSINDTGTYRREQNFTVTWPGGIETFKIYYNLENIPTQTNLSWSAIKKDFTLEILKEDKGAVEIKVISDVPAWNLTFYCKGINVSIPNFTGVEYPNFTWCHFDLSDQNKTYDSNVSDVLVPTFTTPNFVLKEETNKTYTAEVCAKAFNSREYCDTISIFVPYSDLRDICIGTNEEDIINLIDALCQKYPKNFLCNPKPEIVNVTQYQLVPCQPENLTQEEMNLYSLCRKDLGTAQDEVIQLTNSLDSCQSDVKLQAINASQEAQNTRIYQQQTSGGNTLLLWIIGAVVILGGSGGILLLWARRGD